MHLGWCWNSIRDVLATLHHTGFSLLTLLHVLLVLHARLEEGVRVITNIICNRIGMRKLEKSEAGNLIKIVSLLVEDGVHVALSEAVCRQQLSQVFLSEVLEGASMELAGAWWLLINDLGTIPGLVIVPLTFLTVTVPNIIRIILFKFVRVYLFAELFFPKLN